MLIIIIPIVLTILAIVVMTIILLFSSEGKSGFEMYMHEDSYKTFISSCEMFKRLDADTFRSMVSDLNYFLKLKMYIYTHIDTDCWHSYESMKMVKEKIVEQFGFYERYMGDPDYDRAFKAKQDELKMLLNADLIVLLSTCKSPLNSDGVFDSPDPAS